MPSPATILLAEDDRQLVRAIALYLQGRGYHVIAATDGREALARLSEGLPDLLLIDNALPTVMGFEVCRKVREMPGGDALPVLMISAFGPQAVLGFPDDLHEEGEGPGSPGGPGTGEEDQNGADPLAGTAAAGLIDGFLAKPFKLADLDRKIQDLLGGREEAARTRRRRSSSGALGLGLPEDPLLTAAAGGAARRPEKVRQKTIERELDFVTEVIKGRGVRAVPTVRVPLPPDTPRLDGQPGAPAGPGATPEAPEELLEVAEAAEMLEAPEILEVAGAEEMAEAPPTPPGPSEARLPGAMAPAAPPYSSPGAVAGSEVVAILAACMAREATGILGATGGGERTTVVLVGGIPVFAETDSLPHSFGRFLWRNGEIDGATLSAYEAEWRATGTPPSPDFFADREIAAERLVSFLAAYVEDTLLRLMRAGEKVRASRTVSFSDVGGLEEEWPDIGVNHVRVVHGWAAEVLSAEELMARVAPLHDQILVATSALGRVWHLVEPLVSPGPAAAADPDVLDGAPGSEILRCLAKDPIESARILYVLLALGLVTPLSDGGGDGWCSGDRQVPVISRKMYSPRW